MQVVKIAPLVWQVSCKGRYWTVERLGTAPSSWNFRNEAGRRIDEMGRLGKRLAEAVWEFEGLP